MERLEELNRELTEIMDQLNALPRDAFAERHRLRTRQDALRTEASAYDFDRDEQRTTEDLLAELEARRSQLDAIYRRTSFNNATDLNDGSGTDSGLGALGRQANGEPEVAARIGRLESILEQRDVSTDPS